MSDVPVVLVHGWGGSFRETWQRPGWEALLQDIGRSVIGVDLLGHGTAPKPHDPEAYTDLSARIVEAAPEGPIDAVGFSLGAVTLLAMAQRDPSRFRRLVLLGIGESVFRHNPDRAAAIVAAIEGTAPITDIGSQLFAQYAHQPGNDPVALAAIFKRPAWPALTPADLASVNCPTLVVLGDNDFAGPADGLMSALPNARLVTLRKCDHFATTENFSAIDAVLAFLSEDL